MSEKERGRERERDRQTESKKRVRKKGNIIRQGTNTHNSLT